MGSEDGNGHGCVAGGFAAKRSAARRCTDRILISSGGCSRALSGRTGQDVTQMGRDGCRTTHVYLLFDLTDPSQGELKKPMAERNPNN